MPLGWERPFSPGPLSEEDWSRYWTQGFCVVKALLDPARDFPRVLEAIEARVERVAASLLAAGLVSDPCEGESVWTRLACIERQHPEASTLVHADGCLAPAFAELWSHPRLLSAAQQLLGPEHALGGHPSWNLRAKTPRQAAATVAWHQDAAYNGRDSWQTHQVTAWVPLLDVRAANGCMQLLRGGHMSGNVARHTCPSGGTWYVELDRGDAAAQLGIDFEADCVTAEMQAGDVLLFSNLLPHRSLDNTSNMVRWSLDLRWQRLGEPDGAFGLKPCIQMTAPGDERFAIPWAGWAQLDKKSGTAGGGLHCALADPTICGPWLDTWLPLTHHNKHTRAWEAAKAAKAGRQAAD